MTSTTNTIANESSASITFMTPNNIDSETTIDLFDPNPTETHTALHQLIGWLPDNILSQINSVIPHENTTIYTKVDPETRNAAQALPINYQDSETQKILWQLFEEIMPYDMYHNNEAYTEDVISTMANKHQITYGAIGTQGFFVCVPQKANNNERDTINLQGMRTNTREKILSIAIMHITPEGNRVYINEYIEKIGNLWHSYPVSNDGVYERTITLPTPTTL